MITILTIKMLTITMLKIRLLTIRMMNAMLMTAMLMITMLTIRMMKAMHIGPFSFALSALHSSTESQIKPVAAAAEKIEDGAS